MRNLCFCLADLFEHSINRWTIIDMRRKKTYKCVTEYVKSSFGNIHEVHCVENFLQTFGGYEHDLLVDDLMDGLEIYLD